MKRVIVILVVLFAARAEAHIGSPDVFFEGDAGPYRLFVTVRVPQVIPGVATIEIRSSSPDLETLAVVPMRLTGPGSELPPTADPATRSAEDPQFFTASLWLMERGSLQVRITATGAHGPGMLAVPVPATALRTMTMDRGLGALLFGLMLVLALSLVSIISAAVREAALPAGVRCRAAAGSPPGSPPRSSSSRSPAATRGGPPKPTATRRARSRCGRCSRTSTAASS